MTIIIMIIGLSFFGGLGRKITEVIKYPMEQTQYPFKGATLIAFRSTFPTEKIFLAFRTAIYIRPTGFVLVGSTILIVIVIKNINIIIIKMATCMAAAAAAIGNFYTSRIHTFSSVVASIAPLSSVVKLDLVLHAAGRHRRKAAVDSCE